MDIKDFLSRALLVLMLLSIFATPSHAQSQGVGECAWPNCYETKHACYSLDDAVAADDDWPVWSPPFDVTILGGYCYCTADDAACGTPGTIHFEKNRAGVITQIGGTTTTGDVPCSAADAATETLTNFTSGTVTLASFDVLRVDVISAPEAGNQMLYCWTYRKN